MKAVETSEAKQARSGRPRQRLSRRESQALTRARVLEAASDVFAEKGFRAATIADVADRAGYTIGAVYSNFESKDALFRALMSERLARVEADLAAAFGDEATAADTQSGAIAQGTQQELDRLEAAEDAVPPRWWRLLSEYRTYIADDPEARAELAALDRRCRDIIAGHIERFAGAIDIRLPVPATQLVELTTALTDGLRLAHAEGRASMSSGQGLRLVVESMIESAIHRRDRTS
jgi:AcrR family transcriptional regulator